MTQEITEGNKLIAEFMGKSGNVDFHDGKGYVPIYWYNGIHGGHKTPYKEDELEYHKSWDWIMPVIDKINGMGKEYNFAIFKTYVSLTIEKSSKVYKDFSFAYSEYITSTQTGKEAAYKLIVKFVKWENEIILGSELSIPL
jgi:hypothetical protein